MILRIIIIDDEPIFGRILKLAIEGFKSNHEGVVYESNLITGINTYEDAKKYIQTKQDQIDILLIDYNIETHLKGTDLFKLVDKSRYLIYRILHSITSKSQKQTKEEFKNLYNDFCYSKDEVDITKTLMKYETEVLDIKLFGNKEFRNKYFIAEKRLNKAAIKHTVNGVRFFDVLYAETDGKGNERVTIHFRNIISGKIDTRVSTEVTIKDFRECALMFKRVNPSVVINLLWVAEIDTIKNKISFITYDNSLFEIEFSPTGSFDTEVKPFLPEITAIPHFFKG